MREKGLWRRVSRSERCPICDKPDWCLLIGPENAPDLVICARTESDKRAGDAGWLHRLRRSGTAHQGKRDCRRLVVPHRAKHAGQAVEMTHLANRYEETLEEWRRKALADQLGVSADALARLKTGFKARGAWFTFPMRMEPGGAVVGIRLRRADGVKMSERGGKEGVFIPEGIASTVSRLVMVEGPTDAAAALTLGLNAVGRPNCSGGTDSLRNIARWIQPKEVVIIADADPPGQAGAKRLAAALAALTPIVRVVTPPEGIKDLRMWLGRGLTRSELLHVIEAARPRRIGVETRIRRKR